MRVLAIGAHLDDIELACGGTLSSAIKKGHIVKMLVMSKSGYTGLDGQIKRENDIAVKEGINAANRLGVHDIEILDFDTKNIRYESETVENIERVINSFDPDIIFSHWAFDTHQAHEGVAKSTISAARRRNTIYMYEPIAPSGRSYQPFRPQVYSDISETIDDKIEALKEHKTEYGKYGENWIDGVKARARFRGYEMGVEYAETFEVLREEFKLEDE
jgi:LmbE family N-acetylglucosaminyl deacetylase